MKRSIRVRTATINDLTDLAHCFDAYRQFYGMPSEGPACAAFIEDRLANSDSHIFIAEVDGAVAGFTQLYRTFSSIRMGRILILNDLFVLPEFRRIGTAGKLLSSVADFAERSGARYLTLSTAHDNRVAQALYKRHGWRKDEHFLSYEFDLDWAT
jgi:ribosomal protein S18 acetylase RimI-like enzyme